MSYSQAHVADLCEEFRARRATSMVRHEVDVIGLSRDLLGYFQAALIAWQMLCQCSITLTTYTTDTLVRILRPPCF